MHTFALVTPGPTEWVLILVIVLVLFGAKKLPELARSLGQSMNEFRKAREEFDKELHQAGQDLKTAPKILNLFNQGSRFSKSNRPHRFRQTAPVQTAETQPPAQQPVQPS